MTFRFGNGWVTLYRGAVAATGSTASEAKARAQVQRERSTAAVRVVTWEVAIEDSTGEGGEDNG